jgi:hypothetical protein
MFLYGACDAAVRVTDDDMLVLSSNLGPASVTYILQCSSNLWAPYSNLYSAAHQCGVSLDMQLALVVDVSRVDSLLILTGFPALTIIVCMTLSHHRLIASS